VIAGQSTTVAPVALRPHPLFRQSPVEVIMVEAARTPEDTLQIRYIVTGALDRICLAGPAPSVRRDGLWRTTCFEVFILADDTPGYFEANFSPSSSPRQRATPHCHCAQRRQIYYGRPILSVMRFPNG
jgi:hypothetical protein